MKLQCAKLLDWFDQICRHRLIPICVAMWEIPRWKTEWRGGGLALIFNSEGKRMTYNRSWLPLNWRKLVECALSRHPGFGRMSCFLLILLNISPLLYCQYEIYLQSQASRRPVDNFYVIKSGMGTCTRCLSTFRRLFAYRDGIFRRIIYFRAKFRSWVDAFFWSETDGLVAFLSRLCPKSENSAILGAANPHADPVSVHILGEQFKCYSHRKENGLRQERNKRSTTSHKRPLHFVYQHVNSKKKVNTNFAIIFFPFLVKILMMCFVDFSIAAKLNRRLGLKMDVGMLHFFVSVYRALTCEFARNDWLLSKRNM